MTFLIFILLIIIINEQQATEEVLSNGVESELQLMPIEFLSLTQDVVDRFHSLSWEEKVPYLFTKSEWNALVDEFGRISSEGNISHERFLGYFEEFSLPGSIAQFWHDCDANVNGQVDLNEYIHCRGNYGQTGEPYDMNEYEYREAILLENFEPEFKYDENGIIID